MTRINLVPPSELTDQHLFAEFREIKMVPRALARSLATKTVGEIVKRIPAKFTLNTGHVLFFYDKGQYLRNRYKELREELRLRGVNFSEASLFDPDGTMSVEPWNGDYVPDEEAFSIVRARIAEKIAMRPGWYKYRGIQHENQRSI